MNSSERIQKNLEEYQRQLPDAEGQWMIDVKMFYSKVQKKIFQTNLNICSIKEACNIQRHNFSAAFKHHVGYTPKQFIQYHRIEAAKQLLADEQLEGVSVADIAFAVGFEHVSTFTNAFKNRMGTLPSVWRQNNLK